MLMALLPTTALADTPIIEYVDYDITTNTTWHAGDYYICKVGNHEPRVTNGATLTIESGAKVYFSTNTNTLLPESDGKYPYSSLTVTNGSLVTNGVTFTTVPDAAEQTTWRDSGWNGIQAIGLLAGATSLSFTGCTFEYSGFNDAGTLYGNQTNGENSVVNISVSGCTFRDPKAGATAIRYDNGYNTVGTGAISVSNSTFTSYGRGVQVLDNQEDAVSTMISGCTFSNMSMRPLEINGGRQAIVTDCTFDTLVAGQHNGAVTIFDTYPATSETQTVILTGNTFNYGDTANIYPVLIGAGTKINENLIADANNTFGAEYPTAYRYIELTKGVGYSSNHRNAVWGDVGIPYLLTSEIVVTGTDESNLSTLTIKPDVTVCLGDGTGTDNLVVRGTLTAEGMSAKPITFTKKTGVTYGNEISASNNLKGSIVLKHCVMDGLYRGIGITSPGNVASSHILLENCTVQNTQHSMYLAGLNVMLKNCTLIGKGVGTGGGQYVNSITIEGCSIAASGADSGDGIYLEPAKSVVLKNCLIAGFSNYGIAIISNGYQTLEAGAPLIENCTVTGNGHGIVFNISNNSNFYYGAIIRNSIIAGNTGLDLVNKVRTSGSYNYYTNIEDGSIAYSLIGEDGASLTFDQLGYYEHLTLGKIRRIATAIYNNRITGDPLFADAANGDYHVKSAAGRWNGSAWITDVGTSPCIDAGDPVSPYNNEPEPNGGRVNLGCYGNTAEASKSIGGGTPDTTPPSWSADSTLSASAITQTGATLSWSGVSDDTAVTAYRIYQDGTLIQTTSNTSYVISGLSPDADYSFKVEAGDADGNWSTNGPTTPVHTLAATTPSVTVTANPSGSIGIGTTVTLTATPTGIAGLSYQWYSNTTDSATGGSEISYATNATYQPSTATAGTTYYYCVVDSVTSNVVGVTVTSAPPVIFTINVTAGTGGSISPSGTVTVNNGADQTFTITPNSDYSIADVKVDGISKGKITTYTFNNVTANHTISATFCHNGGSSSGSESMGGDSSSGGSTTIPTIPIPEDKPNQPVKASIPVTAVAVTNGTASASITDKTIIDVIAKAQADAKALKTANGTSVALNISMPKGATSLTAILTQNSLSSLVNAKVTNLEINSSPVSLNFDQKTLSEIQKQSSGNISIAFAPKTSLSASAKSIIGTRPVYDLIISYTKTDKNSTVSGFGAGSVSVTIPYTLGANEKAGNVQAVYVDASGKVQLLISSVYDNVNKVLRFSTNHFSTYGVGYKQDAPDFIDINNHWAKDDIQFVVNRGLFSGTSKTTFSPNTAMTRGMFVTALGRLANADVLSYKQSNFTDVKSDAYYMGYIEWANKSNIINGTGNGNFAPDQSITREQMAVIMQNYAKTIGFALPKVHTENTFADSAKLSAYAKDEVKQMQMAGVISGKNGNLFDPQGTTTRAEVSAVLRRFVELAISSDTMQGWTMNDSGKWMYYENGKPITGKKDIDGSIFIFDQYGVTADVPNNLKYTTYTVQKGDSFWLIAHNLGCTMSELERLNNKSRFELIHPGDVLRVPEK